MINLLLLIIGAFAGAIAQMTWDAYCAGDLRIRRRRRCRCPICTWRDGT